MPLLFLARQPIYDKSLKVFAYELLYRATEDNHAPADIGDQATYSVLVNALSEFGLDELVGPHYAFINLTRGFIVGDNPLPFSGDKIVVEVLEDIAAEPEVIAGTKRLASQGYTIALDDFIYDESYKALVELADIIKIDLLTMDREMLKQQVQTLRQFNVKLLAEKVETQEEFEFCKTLGFDYFQGYFFCQPKMLTRQRLPAAQFAAAQLLAKLQNPETEVDELSDIISRDASLSYRLLRYANSAIFALPSEIKSLQHAIVYIGLSAIKQWATVLVMAGMNDKPHELLVTALIRARMCQLLAESHKLPDKESYFIVGLFSVLDALLDRPMDDLLESLNFSSDIKLALLNHEGTAGATLESVIAYQQGNWDHPALVDQHLESINQAYNDALIWTNKVECIV